MSDAFAKGFEVGQQMGQLLDDMPPSEWAHTFFERLELDAAEYQKIRQFVPLLLVIADVIDRRSSGESKH